MKMYKIKVINGSNYFHIEGIRKEYINICYGINKVSVKNSYIENPQDNIIYISKNIADKISLIDDIEYQINFEGNDVTIGPVIGFIVTPQTLKHSKKYFRKYLDRLLKYNEFKGLFIFYSACNVDFDNDSVYGAYYNDKIDDFVYSKLPIPKFNYRRNFKDDTTVIRKLEEHGINILNSYKLVKQDFYNYISTTPLHVNIPFTYNVYNVKCIMDLIYKHTNIILKPRDLSRGRGIAIIKSAKETYEVYRYPEAKFLNYNKNELLEMLYEYNLDGYLVQEYLDLNDYKGYIYDIRVVVQLVEGKYKISGIETRVSRNNTITNVSGGATVISFNEALIELDNNQRLKVAREIKRISIETAEYLNINNNIIELGIDIALTKNLSIYVLEANIYPSFKGFMTLNENIFDRIRFNPIKELIRMEGMKVSDQ